MKQDDTEDVSKDSKNDKKNEREQAPEDSFSHYLTLANGETVRFDVATNDGAFPADWNGIPVVGARGSTVGGPV